MAQFFKYINDNSDALRSLLDGHVKFTPIPELNDPSELVPKCNPCEIHASLERLRKDGHSDDDMKYLCQQGRLLQRLASPPSAFNIPKSKEEADAMIRSPRYNRTQSLVEYLRKIVDDMSSQIGLLCLSSRRNSLPMWAHYAGNATGLIVEFADLESTFQGDETGILSKPIPVKYDKDVTKGVTFKPKSHETLFFFKFPDWAYEHEIRVVLPLADCQRHEAENGKTQFLFQLPDTCVKHVILGWNMAPEREERVTTLVSRLNPRVQVFRAKFDFDKDDVVLESVAG